MVFKQESFVLSAIVKVSVTLTSATSSTFLWNSLFFIRLLVFLLRVFFMYK